MGTRHLIVVKHNDRIRVAQYGQWDGYPTGQGLDIVEFLNNKTSLENLRKKILRVELIKDNDPVIVKYNKNAGFGRKDKRTVEQKNWFRLFVDRDLGAKILTSIAQSRRKKILLLNRTSFAEEELFCEYSYVVNLDNDELRIYGGGGFLTKKPIAVYSFDNLPSKEDLKNLEK